MLALKTLSKESGGGTVSGSDNLNISSSYSGWIDLFGWGSCDNPPQSTPSNNDHSVFHDWGSKVDGTWRTLTKDEWAYMIEKRHTPSGILFARAIVNNVKGLILLPDNWNNSTYNLKETNIFCTRHDYNKISAAEWNNVFSPAGAVFLPAAGWRTTYYSTSKIEVGNLNEFGGYWSSSIRNDNRAFYHMYLDEFHLISAYPMLFDRYNDYAFSVRLVCPVEN